MNPRPRSAWRLRTLALLTLMLLLVPPNEAAPSPVLSDHDAASLRRGAIVFSADVPPGPTTGGGMGGTAVALLHAETEAVWQTLLDFPGHAELFPRLKESAVVERRANQTLVSYRVAVGMFSFRFFVRNYADALDHILRWELDQSRRNTLFRDHWGYWKVEPWEEGTLVTYAMGGRTTLPAFLTRGAGREGVILAVKALKVRVEQRQAL